MEKDTTKWAQHILSHSPAPQIFFSALATSRAAAGGFDNQYSLEHDLNVELAKAAKEAGSKVYVLISSATSNKDSRFGYVRMKGEIEEIRWSLKRGTGGIEEEVMQDRLRVLSRQVNHLHRALRHRDAVALVTILPVYGRGIEEFRGRIK